MMTVNEDEMKRKIRKLKKLEQKIRYENMNTRDNKHGAYQYPFKINLVWDEFFDLSENGKKKVKYPLSKLVQMDKEEYKNAVSEFLFYVYCRFYKEKGYLNVSIYDPDILMQMGLPYDADSTAIKKRFRELAKQYHPDTGGDSEKFIEMMENFKALSIDKG
jgi:hypothetical protein